MMYKHSHTCWAHSHPLLPKQWQSVSQFSRSSLPESLLVSVFSGRKALHSKSSLGLAWAMICFGCYFLPNFVLFFIDLILFLMVGICKSMLSREHKWTDRWDGQKADWVRTKSAKSEKEISELQWTEHCCITDPRRKMESLKSAKHNWIQ